MTARAARRGLAATLAVGCALLGACTTRQADATGIPTERGGTLHVLFDSRVEAWDPQRIGTDSESAFAVRTFVAHPDGPGAVRYRLPPRAGR